MHGAVVRAVGQSALLAAVYAVVANACLALDAVSGFATLVWPPTGISLVAVLMLGPRVLPGVFVGAFAANLWNGAPVTVALGIGFGNAIEAFAGAAALRRFGMPSFAFSLARVGNVLTLIAFAAIGSTLISATIGVLSLRLGGVIADDRAVATWLAWWVGDGIGNLVVAPALLAALAGSTPSEPWHEPRPIDVVGVVERVLLGALLVVVSALVFAARSPHGPTGFERAYIVFPLLIWAGLRFGSRGAALASFAVSVVGIAGAVHGGGPFVRPHLSDALLQLQSFMAIAACSTLIMGAASDERRQALAVRESLIALAAHELKTPLTSLQLRAQKLKRTVRANAPEDAALARDSEVVERLVKRTGRLVDDLLDVTRIMAGKLTLEVESVDLFALAREVVERLPESQQALVSVVGRDEPIVGEWDRLRLDQVVSNLLSNAIKYGEQRPVEIVVERAGRRVRLAVHDRGNGIAEHDRARIFERFERAASNNVSGFGVGLWIVRNLTRALGGTVGVESDLGRGSTFVVELPLRAPVGRGP